MHPEPTNPHFMAVSGIPDGPNIIISYYYNIEGSGGLTCRHCLTILKEITEMKEKSKSILEVSQYE